MQHSSMTLFCNECGLANDASSTHCAACQHPLTVAAATLPTAPQIIPVSISLPTVREVRAGGPLASDQQGALTDFPPGTILAGCYQIEQEIGRGGFSIVYRAMELDEPDRKVAIKRIPLNTLTASQVIDATETFNREISMLKRFTGTRGVPKFYGQFSDQENWYLVIRYIEGGTLEECLQQAPGGYFAEKQAIRIGIKLAQIFQGLHTDRPPVIFRDVKPANIMLTPEQELFLIDFGIARNFTFGKARDTTPLGSPGYAAPEQYGRAQTNRQADIYGLGATLQTLVTGRDPLELAAGEPSRNPDKISPQLRTLLDSMLAPVPAQRPVDMLHVQTLLENILRPPGNSSLDLKPGSISDDNKQRLANLAVSMYFFYLLSRLSIGIGVIYLINWGVNVGISSEWFKKKYFMQGKVAIFSGRAVTIVWRLLVLLVIWRLCGGALPF